MFCQKMMLQRDKKEIVLLLLNQPSTLGWTLSHRTCPIVFLRRPSMAKSLTKHWEQLGPINYDSSLNQQAQEENWCIDRSASNSAIKWQHALFQLVCVFHQWNYYLTDKVIVHYLSVLVPLEKSIYCPL